jgi:hypothetical protein
MEEKWVAWIDVRGFSTLWVMNHKAASSILGCLRRLVTDCCSEIPGVQVFGVNDGFYVFCDDVESLLKKIILLYQVWFDRHSMCLHQRPLLRGALAEKSEVVSVDSTTCIRFWLEEGGFQESYEDERLLRGGRFFCPPSLKEPAEKAGIPFYGWTGLSGWNLPEGNCSREIIELAWVAASSTKDIEDRSRRISALYKEVLLADSRSDNSTNVDTCYLNYEETLKLMLRSVALHLREHPGDSEELERMIADYVCFDRGPFKFIWGVNFVALEAAWLSRHPRRKALAQELSARLEKKKSHSEERAYVDNFNGEMRHPTYSCFRKWYEETSGNTPS